MAVFQHSLYSWQHSGVAQGEPYPSIHVGEKSINLVLMAKGSLLFHFRVRFQNNIQTEQETAEKINKGTDRQDKMYNRALGQRAGGLEDHKKDIGQWVKETKERGTDT